MDPMAREFLFLTSLIVVLLSIAYAVTKTR